MRPAPCLWLLALALLTPALPAAAARAADEPESRPAPDSQPADTQPAETQPAESQPAAGPATQSRPARPGRRPRRAESGPATTATSGTATSSAADEKDEEHFLAVVNGRVFTVSGPVLERATVLSRNGKIIAIGPDVALPRECEIVDATNRFVYPGLVAAGASGVHGAGDPRDSTDVYSLSMNLALAGGITSAIAGNAAAKLTFGRLDDMLIRNDLFINIEYSRGRPIERARLRADLERVRNYLRELDSFNRDKATNKDAKEPDKGFLRERFESYRKLLAREAVATATANTAQDLIDLSELAAGFDFDICIRGAYEGWTVPRHLARARAKLVITPRTTVDADETLNRLTGSTIENARLMQDLGLPVAVVPGIVNITTWGVGGRDLLHLNMEAAFAVRGGMANDDALRTITIDAARVLGIDDRVGSLEVGKDADIIVADGDILSYMTRVHHTIVNGRVAYEKAKDSLYAHIRPTGQRNEATTFEDVWPRRLEWPRD